MDISKSAARAAYELSRDVMRRRQSVATAAQTLAESQSLNEVSAANLINNIRHLLGGEVYKRKMSKDCTDALLACIHEDHGALGLETALQSVHLHLTYYENLHGGGRQGAVRSVVNRYQNMLDQDSSLAVPHAFIPRLAEELNELSTGYQIGDLQQLRKHLHGRQRQAARSIFVVGNQSVADNWAYHYGGRTEAQFNIGEEEGRYVRHGLAFSFTPSQSLSDPAVLAPKVHRWNDFFRDNAGTFSDMSMWHFQNGTRSVDRPPGPIHAELVDHQAFVIVGKRVPFGQLDRHQILKDFDRLLLLYEYIERADLESPETKAAFRFNFRPGCPVKRSATKATLTQHELDVELRHNDLQQKLYRALVKGHSVDNVGTEIRNGPGTSIDLVVKLSGSYEFYEIKTAATDRGCLREALGQLLEYAYWPGTQSASRLVVVGPAPLTPEGQQYVELLRDRFQLPLFYEQLALDGRP